MLYNFKYLYYVTGIAAKKEILKHYQKLIWNLVLVQN